MNYQHHTKFSRNENIHELRVLAYNLLAAGNLEWRHHGIGLLQAYMSGDWNQEVRLHIWHPDLKIPGMEKSGGLHNHRFTLVSTVLAGRIHHREYEFTPDPNGEWRMWTVLNARAGSEPPKPASELRYAGSSSDNWIYEGTTYEFDRGCFHETSVAALSVTLVTKKWQAQKRAIIVSPHDMTPVHAFDPNRELPDMKKYVSMAKEALLKTTIEADDTADR